MKQATTLPTDWQPYYVNKGAVSNRVEKEREVMRLYDCLRAMPSPLVRVINARQIKDAFDIDLPEAWIRGAHKRFLEHLATQEKNMETTMQKEYDPQKHLSPDLLIERLATIVAHSYAHLGDNEDIGSEDALKLMKKQLLQYDQKILLRTEKRRLPK